MGNINVFHLLMTVLAGWVNRYQLAIIDYLIDECRIFMQQISCRQLRLLDDVRRHLAGWLNRDQQADID